MRKRQKMKRKKFKPIASESQPQIDSGTEKQTGSLHKDQRGTAVLVGYKIYNLSLTNLTIEQLSKQDPKTRPHIRFLNPIPLRSEFEQEMKNNEEHSFHEIYKLIESQPLNNKVTSVKKAIRMGANVPDEVKKLLELKETITDPDQKRKIRQQLRKLDYRRYSEKEN